MNLEPFRLERFFANQEFSASYNLGASDCESMSIGELIALEEGSEQGLSNIWLGYTETRGDRGLRSKIAQLYGKLLPENILVHAGAEEAIFNFINVAVKPGDHVIVHSPYYQSLGTIARGIGAKVTEWKGDANRNWELDMQFLRDKVTTRTTVVVVNFPHNPTGFLPSLDFLHELSSLSDERGFVILSDEVYRGLEYDPADRLPSVSDINERSVSISVMSKIYGLAGLRIGWTATRNRNLYEKLAEFKDYTSICNSAPSEYLSGIALRNAHTIVDRNLQIIRDNLDRLDDFFRSFDGVLDWYRPKAGTIAFPRYLGDSVEVFCDELVREAGVLLVPGTLYGAGYGCVRIGFGRRNLPEALREFGRYLTDHR
ncbi:MAG: aminotransferase class I/II-fold pyridoxal phosphate-dependent enzyme [Anaerolineales bacterium]